MENIVTEKNAEIDDLLKSGWKRVGSYVKSHIKIELVCEKGHTVFLRLDHIRNGIGCVFCSGLVRLTDNDIDDRLDNGWKRISHYTNNETMLELICPEGHLMKMKWANYQQGKRCLVCFKEKNRGENHASWKSWLTNEIRERYARKTTQYNDWRKNVYKRDNYACLICNTLGKNLEAHHLLSFHSNPDVRYEISNGVTLCGSCHIDFHRKYGKQNNTPEQFEEYYGKHRLSNH